MKANRIVLVVALAAAAGCRGAEQPPPDPEADFRAQIGRQWELARLGPLEIPVPPPGTPPDVPGRDLVPGRRPTLRFSADPQGVGGRSFCNGWGGPYALRGDSLRIERIESSAVGCDGPDSVETRFFRGLRETRRFELDSASLSLIAADGSRLVFVPADTMAQSAPDTSRRRGSDTAAPNRPDTDSDDADPARHPR